MQAINLPDGRVLQVELLTYPIGAKEQMELIQLWRSEWRSTDLDWLETMNGDYADTLTIKSVLGRIDGRPVSSASIFYPRVEPEVAVVGSVLTHPDFRRLAMARKLVGQAVQLAWQAGCGLIFLGATRSQHCVYLHCGFDWVNGGVMRQARPGHEKDEDIYFASGQHTSIRQAQWGDVPGVSALMAQPMDWLVLDYPRGLLSGKYVTLQRCVSNFPVIYYEVRARQGVMVMLIGEKTHRVLGFGTLTPGPGPNRRYKGLIDLAVHDNYVDQAERIIERLLSEAKQKQIEVAQAYIAGKDQQKGEIFRRAGFAPIARLSEQLRVGDQAIGVELLERKVSVRTGSV